MKIGDKVKVKTWDEIANMGKYDEDGDIKLSDSYFLRDMKPYCEQEYTIVRIEDGLYQMKDIPAWLLSSQTFDKIEELKEDKNIIKSNKKYIILDKRTENLQLNDGWYYFDSIEDAQSYILESHGDIQLLSILEVSKVFECEVNFKEAKE